MIEEIIIFTLNNPGWPTPEASSEFYIYLLTIIPAIFLIFAITFLLCSLSKSEKIEENLHTNAELSES